MVYHLGQLGQDPENLSKSQKPGANLCLSHLKHSSNESCSIRHLLAIWQHKQPGTPPCILRAWTQSKDTTQNQRPARSTYLGKNKGFPANQKGSGKMKGWNEKNLYTRQVENLKGRLGKKWASRWTENPKGRSRKKLGIKRNTMSHWITLHPKFGINYLAQTSASTN